jgi:hypothetical protein
VDRQRLVICWFVGLGIEDPVRDATSFTKNRDRLLEGEVAVQFLAAVLSQDKVERLLSSECFTVDGTLLEAWASPKSLWPKDGSGKPPGPGRNGVQDFSRCAAHQRQHISTPDPDARLYRKGPGKEVRLSFIGHALMENRNGLIVGVTTCASGHAARLAALALIEPHADRKTVAGSRKMRHRGLPKVDRQFTLTMATYDLVRLPKLLAQPAV